MPTPTACGRRTSQHTRTSASLWGVPHTRSGSRGSHHAANKSHPRGNAALARTYALRGVTNMKVRDRLRRPSAPQRLRDTEPDDAEVLAEGGDFRLPLARTTDCVGDAGTAQTR